MSSLLSILSENVQNSTENELIDISLDYFNHSNQPYDELLEFLTKLSESHHNNNKLIDCLIQSFLQWKNQSKRNLSIPYIDENLIRKTLPIC